jgi:hypothetical protein
MWPFSSPPAAEKKPKRRAAVDPNAELLAEIFTPAPDAPRREPDWIDPAAPKPRGEPRPYLQLGEGELERHARDEELPEDSGPSGVPGPSQLFGLLMAPFSVLPEGVRHVTAAICIFGALSLGIQFVLKPVLVLCGALDP